MPPDQDLPDIEIGYSPLRLLRLVGMGLVMTAASAPLAFNWYGIKNISPFLTAVGYFGLFFFGWATCKFIWLLISSRNPVVFINRNGIIDKRISDELIEWGSVDKISIWQYHRQKLVMLKVTALLAKRLVRSTFRRVLSSVNKILGVDGVTINSSGLTIDADTLFDTCGRYRAAFLFADGVGYAARSQTLGETEAFPVIAPSEAVVGLAAFKLPWVTFLLLAVLVVIFVLENVFAVTPSVRSNPSIATLLALGALSSKAIISNGQWYRLFTAPLLHASVAHIVGNGVALLMGGWLLERFVGRLWFFALFVIGALGGSLMSLAVGSPNLISVGASGALMGIFAALCVGSFRLAFGTPARSRMQVNSARVLVPSLIPLFSTSSVHIDYGAHFGGALSGAVVAAFLLKSWPETERIPQLRKVAAATSGVGAILFVASACIVVVNYPKYHVAVQPLQATNPHQSPFASPQLNTSAPETQSNGLPDHGPGRVACDGQWSDLMRNGSEKPADSYPDFIRNCMKK
jgi:membrane associated rhomboid family serine protease